jgi:hypothetical protein
MTTDAMLSKWHLSGFHFPEQTRMGIAAEVADIMKYPLTIGLLGATAVAVITKDLAILVH